VIKRLDLEKVFKTQTPDETRRALEGSVKMQAGKDGIIAITADSKDPKMAAALANAFVEELGRKSVQLNLTKAGTERAFLEKRLEVVREDLKRAEEDLRSFELKNKAVKVDSQAAASIEGIARLKAEIVAREVQLASLRSYQTDESPEVKVLQAAIGKLRSQLGGLAGSGSGGEGIPNIGSLPNLGLEYARRMRELKTQEAIYEQLTKQFEMAKLTEAKDSSSLQVLDDAVVPLKKSKPKRSLIVILATVTAFFIAVFTAFVLEYFGKMSDEDRARWEAIRGMLIPRKNKA
jgi:tyrosine-protein kinase Etk/Wzc